MLLLRLLLLLLLLIGSLIQHEPHVGAVVGLLHCFSRVDIESLSNPNPSIHVVVIVVVVVYTR